MSTPGELATFAYNKRANGCFLVPKKQNKWFFGRLQHNISWAVEDDCGTFLLSDGSVKTFSLKHVTEAVARLKNKIPMHLSEYKKEFKFVGKEALDFQEGRIVGEELRVLMEKSLAEYRATAPAKPVRTGAVQKPTPPKPIFPHPVGN